MFTERFDERDWTNIPSKVIYHKQKMKQKTPETNTFIGSMNGIAYLHLIYIVDFYDKYK